MISYYNMVLLGEYFHKLLTVGLTRSCSTRLILLQTLLSYIVQYQACVWYSQCSHLHRPKGKGSINLGCGFHSVCVCVCVCVTPEELAHEKLYLPVLHCVHSLGKFSNTFVQLNCALIKLTSTLASIPGCGSRLLVPMQQSWCSKLKHLNSYLTENF